MKVEEVVSEHPAIAPAGSVIVLLYDPDEEETVSQKLTPLFGDRTVDAVPFSPGDKPAYPQDTVVVAYLDDAALSEVVFQAAEQEWILGFLPHPEMYGARTCFGTDDLWQNAVDDLISAVRVVELDLLLCNDVPVFDRVVLGDLSPLAEADPEAGPSGRLQHLVRRLKGSRGILLRAFTITTGMDKKLETAALGIIALESGSKSVFARGIIDETHRNDGMLHAIVLAPRALTEIIKVWVQALLRRSKQRSRLPSFAGHIRSSALTINSSTPFTYVRDGIASKETEIRLKVLPVALRTLPGRNLEIDAGPRESKEIFRIKGLPVGEARSELISNPIPFRHHAATEEFRELFQQLRESATLSGTYLTLMILSSLLSTFGLFAGSGPVIIGAMILAPLMAPIISLSMGVLRQNESFITDSLKTLTLGVAVAVGSAAVLTWFTPLHTINSEISARLNPTLLDLGVAVLSGIAGAYAHARSEIARSLAGVAIAVALVPPLATAGIGLGWFDWSVFSGAFLLFLTNLAGIVLSAALTFLALGFSPFHRAGRGLIVSLGLVLVVSVPLGFGFNRMVEENRVVRSLDGLKVHGVTLRDVTVRAGEPLHIKATMLSDRPVDERRMRSVKRAITEQLGEPVVLEVIVAVVL